MIEMVEPEVANSTYGFLEYLDAYLDRYVPRDKESYYPRELNGENMDKWDNSACSGMWPKEDGYAWIRPQCRISLCNSNITSNGLEMQFTIPEQMENAGASDMVEIRVNGTVVWEKTYTKATTELIKISPEQFTLDDSDCYVITISSSWFFNPQSAGIAEDNRDLSMIIRYVGGVR